MLQPSTVEEAGAALAELARDGRAVRPSGQGTRWGGRDGGPVVALGTSGLCRVLEHNPGDFTAVLEAGVPVADAQAAFAGAGQWLAIDPPPGGTIGGLVATADSGPSRHRYGGMRDLVIGVTVVLGDGGIARAGGKVIKNVAGYDLGKLFTGSYGTLGLVAAVAVRLHPLPRATATATVTTDDPVRLGALAVEAARRPLEALCLDAWWHGERGGLLIRFGGAAAAEQARSVRLGDAAVEVVEDDEPLWSTQRSRQRSAGGVVLKVAGRPTDLAAVVGAARAQAATVVSRAGLGLSWLALGPTADVAERVAAVRAALAPRSCTVQDGAELVEQVWPAAADGVLELSRRVKARFDPARILRPAAGVWGL